MASIPRGHRFAPNDLAANAFEVYAFDQIIDLGACREGRDNDRDVQAGHGFHKRGGLRFRIFLE